MRVWPCQRGYSNFHMDMDSVEVHIKSGSKSAKLWVGFMAYHSYNLAGSGIANCYVLCVPRQPYLVEAMLWLHRGSQAGTSPAWACC